MDIPYNRPYMTGRELDYIRQAHAAGHLSGDGPFTKKCHAWLEAATGCRRALLTTSATAALEMSATLLNIGAGDEVIVPSFTFVTTANAFVTRGATPVFVDVRPDTLNIDEAKIEAAITGKTRAIVPVHYAGVGCEMGAIMRIADRHGVSVVEDAAQGIMASREGKALGSVGHLGALSFHESKNIICGEGGALLINDESLTRRAEIIWEKGTDRRDFYRGVTDKYTWRDVGSSYLPSDALAAFLWAQLEEADAITARRMRVWSVYDAALRPVADELGIVVPTIPAGVVHNAHIYHLLLPDAAARARFIAAMAAAGMQTTFHYVPLHSSPGGDRFGRTAGAMTVTDDIADRLVRLPLWVGLEDRAAEVAEKTVAVLRTL
jgi:dTDP-4-amino-4,6-dideoxygalactose transaminase